MAVDNVTITSCGLVNTTSGVNSRRLLINGKVQVVLVVALSDTKISRLLAKITAARDLLGQSISSSNFSKAVTKAAIEKKFLRPTESLDVDETSYYSNSIDVTFASQEPTSSPTSSGDNGSNGIREALYNPIYIIVAAGGLFVVVIAIIVLRKNYATAIGSDAKDGEDNKINEMESKGAGPALQFTNLNSVSSIESSCASDDELELTRPNEVCDIQEL